MKKESFLDLYKTVIKKNLCSACGSCVISCPLDLLDFREQVFFNTKERETRVEKEQLNKVMEKCISCGKCYEGCPKIDFNLEHAEKNLFGEVKYDALGNVLEAFSGQAIDPYLVNNSQSGGLVTALLKYGLEEEIFDAAIVAGHDDANPWKPVPIIVTKNNIQLLNDTQKTKYFPSSMLIGLDKAIKEYHYKNIAITLIPCQLHGLYTLKSKDLYRAFNNVNIFTFGLFCFGTYWEHDFMEWLHKKHKINEENIEKLNLDRKTFTIKLKDGNDISGERKKITKFMLHSCKFCSDFTNVLADVSIGATASPDNWSTLLVRKKEALNFVQAAKEAGYIKLKPLDTEKMQEIYDLSVLKFKYHVDTYSLKVDDKKLSKLVPDNINIDTTASAHVMYLQINTLSGLSIYSTGEPITKEQGNEDLFGGFATSVLLFSRTLTDGKAGLTKLEMGPFTIIIEYSKHFYALAIVLEDNDIVRQKLKNILNKIEEICNNLVEYGAVDMNEEKMKIIDHLVKSEITILS